MARLLGYARVSTLDQNPELQQDGLAAAGCERIFTDQASGALHDRPELTKVLDHLYAGDTLVVWKLDRLGRSLPHLVDTVYSLRDRDVGFQSLHDGINLASASGRLQFGVFAALAEFERDLIRERTYAGLAAARARGRVGGRPSTMTPEKLGIAKQMRDTGEHTMTAIASTIGVSRATLYRHLGNNHGVPQGAGAHGC